MASGLPVARGLVDGDVFSRAINSGEIWSREITSARRQIARDLPWR